MVGVAGRGFTVNGTYMNLTPDEVVQRLRGVKPSPIRTHAVTVGDVAYPVKQALSVVTGEDIADFNTNVARSAFKKLGFKVERVP